MPKRRVQRLRPSTDTVLSKVRKGGDPIDEWVREGDKFYDYQHLEYTPVAPVGGKLRSCALLLRSFEALDCESKLLALVKTIQEEIGVNNTVWGVKKSGRTLEWEFYFYNFEKKILQMTITHILSVIDPFLRCDWPIDENLPYSMFSLDINPAALAAGKIAGIHIYVLKKRAELSYFVHRDGIRLENYYPPVVVNPETRLDEVKANIRNSVFIDAEAVPMERLIPAPLLCCEHIAIANKYLSDCIYYSRINVDQLLFFLEHFQYPENILGFVRENWDKLDHLRYDVGFDYRMINKTLEIPKSGFYGVF